jgi:8-amino-7-oxononanoate synthase
MFEHELSFLIKNDLYRCLKVVESCQGPRVTMNGKSVLLMCSNDYLGLANHPTLCNAAGKAMTRYGFGAGASRLVSGSSALHHELEGRLAGFKRTEAALVFNSGYAANTGIIQAVAEAEDVILSDSMNHASIVDGCRLSRATTLVYRHNDTNHLEELLRDSRNFRRRLIVTDGVFSMDGDIAPLPELVSLAERHAAILMVDDAHATGVLGKTGKGTVEHFNLDGRVPIQMGTLGKALGTFGAYAAGNRDLIEYLINRARSFIYSTALPPLV